MTPDALALLTKIGQETGLRYASNLITTSTLLSQKRKAKAVELEDVQRSFKLFYDAGRSVSFVAQFEKRFIGDQGGVTFSVANGDAMEIS